MTANDKGSEPDVDELHAWCVELATGAAEIVRRGRGDRSAIGAVGTKSSDTDLVTDVDRATERWLRAQILQRRPSDTVLGEEAGTTVGRGGVRWLLDPIDGTVNFVLGLPLYAVSVAAEVAGEVVAGAVVNPVSGEVFHARRAGGAFLGDERLDGPRSVDLPAAVIATGFNYDRGMRTRQIDVAARLLPKIGDVRRLGTAALELCFLAAGRVDGYYEAGLHEWDHAAGALVAAEAGCVVSGLRGRAVSGVMVAAAGPELAAGLFALLEEYGADEVTG